MSFKRTSTEDDHERLPEGEDRWFLAVGELPGFDQWEVHNSYGLKNGTD